MSKEINIENKTTKDQVAVLSFNEITPSRGQLYYDVFPVAWKVFYLSAGNNISRTYDPTFSALLCELESGNTVRSRDTRLTTLGKNHKAMLKDGFNKFIDEPQNTAENTLSITNIGNEYLTAAIGDGKKAPLMVQKDILGNEAAVFIPKTKLYITLTRNYKENEAIKSEIVGPKLVVDLASLGANVNIIIEVVNGQVNIRLA